MYKITLALCLSTIPLCSSALNLPVKDNSEPDKTTVIVPLGHLLQNKLYKISCDINNNQQEFKVLFAPRLLSSSTYGNVKWNEDLIPNNSAKLKQGKNQLSFLITFKQKDEAEYNQFSLEGASQSFEVEQCRAEEQSLADIKTITKSAAQVKNALNGSFLIYNDTNNIVRIAVGNFFPTAYSISPHGSKSIYVSSDNQNVHIREFF